MKLYLNVEQAKLVRDALYTEQKEAKAALEQDHKHLITEVAEARLQELDRLTHFLNEQIERETT